MSRFTRFPRPLRTQQVTITRKPSEGEAATIWNVDLDGRPFGQISTYKPRPGYTFGFTATTLGGASASGLRTLEGAQRWIREQM